MLAGNDAEAIRIGREALAMADLLVLPDVRVNALNNIGAARGNSGDPRGVDDLREAVRAAAEHNLVSEGSRARANLASVLWSNGSLELARTTFDEFIVIDARYGQVQFVRWLRGNRSRSWYTLGDWNAAYVEAKEFLAEVEAGSPHYLAAECHMTLAAINLGRDDVAGALAEMERSLDLARRAKDRQMLQPALAIAAQIFIESGDADRAAALADELLTDVNAPDSSGIVPEALHAMAWTLCSLGRPTDFLEFAVESDVPWMRAARAFASGDFRGSADIYAEMGAVTDEARDRLRFAKSLVEEGRRSEADVELRHVLAFYRSAGATRYVRQGEALLTASA